MKNLSYFERYQPQGEFVMKTVDDADQEDKRFISAGPSKDTPGLIYIQCMGSRGWHYTPDQIIEFANYLTNLALKGNT